MTLHLEQKLRKRCSGVVFVIAVVLWAVLSTYLYQAQEKYAEETAKDRAFREFFESSQSALLLVDRDGHIVDWNRAAEELFGWSAEQMRGKHIAFLFRLRSDGEVAEDEIEFWNRRLLQRDWRRKVLQVDCPLQRHEKPPLPAVVEIWKAELKEPPPDSHSEEFFAIKVTPKDQIVRMPMSGGAVSKE